MSLLVQHLDLALTTFQHLADPVDSGPVAPGGNSQAQANAIFGMAKWAAYVIAGILIVGAGVMIGVSHQSGRPNDGLAKLGAILASIGVVSAAGAIAGTISGV